MKDTYNPETVARCDAFIYHILSHAPEGVNIKAERKGETAHFYIMNAPAPLYDFTGYGSAVHHVKPNGENFCANENYNKILADLRETLPIYKAAHGSARVEHVMHIGHPRRSFVPMAKNTPTPKRSKAAPLAAYVIPKAEQGTRNAEIVAAMWRELAAVLNNMQTTDDEPRRELAKLSDEIRAGIVKYNGDDSPRAYNFEGLAITCAPTALAYIFVKFCKTFRYKPVKMVTLLSAEEEAAPATVVKSESEKVAEVAAPAAVVESEPEKVAEVAPVEVKAVERRRLGLGCMVARLVVALLSLIIAGLRVAVAAIRLAERGRLAEVVAEKIARAAEALRVAVVGRYTAICSAICARVEAWSSGRAFVVCVVA